MIANAFSWETIEVMDQEIELYLLHICHFMFFFSLSKKPVARREEPCISKQRKTLGKSSPSSTISSSRSSLGDLHANKNNCG